jgi:DNA ligase-1
MLLTPYVKCVSLKTSKIWYVSEKYDGWRLHYYNGEFITRQKEIITLPSHFYEEADDLCRYIAESISQSKDQIVLDGELWCGRGKFNTIKSSIKNNSNNLTYQVFDYGLIEDNYKIGFSLRNDLMSNLKDIKSRALQIVKHSLFEAHDEKGIEKYYEKIIRNNGEGIVLRPYDLIFTPLGGRIPNFYKLKPFEIDEFEVLDYHTTQSAAKQFDIKDGYVSSLICKMNDDSDNTFKVTCKTFKKYLPKIGEYAKIKYTQTTCKGLPKFPVLYLDSKKKIPKAHKIQKPKKVVKVKELYASRTINSKSYQDWIKFGGYDLSKGNYVKVVGNQTYIVKHCHDGAMMCSCIAWKYQKLNPKLRTCKHCIAVCGKDAEMNRIETMKNNMS